MKWSVLTFAVLIISVTFSFAQVIPKSVFNNNQESDNKWLLYQNNQQALYKIITNEAFYLLEQRSNQINSLKTKEDWINYQKELKLKFEASLQQFKKTPLNARITGKLERERFTVEKIIYESHHGFYATGCLFLPKKRQNRFLMVSLSLNA